jgi:hypothetical protein
MAQMIIANRLTDGRVVFLAAPRVWVTSIDDGRLIDDESAAEELFSVAKKDESGCLVIDPNLIEVEGTAPGRRPVVIREAIRAFGPSALARTDRRIDS